MLTVDVSKDFWDFFALAFSVLAVGATFAALWIAVQDSKEANRRTLLAEAREESAKDETRALRAQQKREQEDAYAAAWADRCAIQVRVSGTVDGSISGDLHAELNLKVENNSDRAIHDVVVRAETHMHLNGRPLGEWKSIAANSDEQSIRQMVYVGGHGEQSRNPKFILLFTDEFGNRWRLAHDLSLYLMRRRYLGMDPNPIDESGMHGT
jgi:heme exporter protein D